LTERLVEHASRLGATLIDFLFRDAGGGQVAGAIVLGVTAAFLLAGGIFLGYAFVRAAISMTATAKTTPALLLRSFCL
jgi:hypothetical protein